MNEGADYHATVIQRQWRIYQQRKCLQDMQLFAQGTAAGQHGPLHAQQDTSVPEHVLQQQQELTLPEQQQQQEHAADTSMGSIQRAVQDVWIATTARVVRNRGALRAAVDARKKDAASSHIQRWHQFTRRQAEQYVAAPHNPQRKTLAGSACYKLQVQRLRNLPQLTQANSSNFGLQLGVSLFDELPGSFYGSTCYSRICMPQQQTGMLAGQGSTAATNMDIAFDVFFHSKICDAHSLAVVEVILVELDKSAAAKERFSLGWAQLPLFSSSTQPAAQALKGQGTAATLFSGTPRYLLFRSVCGSELPPPATLLGSEVVYQVEAWPAMAHAKLLLPEDCLVTYTDVIPGLRRCDSQGKLTTSRKGTNNTLPAPVLASALSVSLVKLEIHVPRLLHNLLSVLPQLVGEVQPPDFPAMLAVPSQAAAVSYTLCIGMHNGRTFVGPQLILQQLQAQTSLGSVVLTPRQQEQRAGVHIDWLLVDELVVLVLELLATPIAAQGFGSTSVLVGRTVLPPFQQISPDGSSAQLAQGHHKLSLPCSSVNNSQAAAIDGCCCPLNLVGGQTQGMLPANWRALLHDTAARKVPDPAVQFEVVAADRHPIVPTDAFAAAAAAECAAANINLATAASQAAAIGSVAEPASAMAVNAAQPAVQVAKAPTPMTAKLEAALRPEAKTTAAAAAALNNPFANETPAVRSLRLAAQQLEDAANIPVMEWSAPPSAVPSAAPSIWGAAEGSQQQQKQLTDTMQQQIDILAKAVEELKQERETIRSSLTLLESAAAASLRHNTAGVAQFSQCEHISSTCSRVAGGAGSSPSRRPESPSYAAASSNNSVEELARLKAMQPTNAAAAAAIKCSMLAYSGAQAGGPMLHGVHSAGTGSPSRRVMQQLHEAGMSQALPTDIQALLKHQAASIAGRAGSPWSQAHQQWLQNGHVVALPHGYRVNNSSTDFNPFNPGVEARDARTASDIVLQLLAFRPSANPGAVNKLPSTLHCLHFTLQFYQFGPTVTEQCLLAAAGVQQQHQHQQLGTVGQQTAGWQVDGVGALTSQQAQPLQAISNMGVQQAEEVQQTLVLMPARQVQRPGAGLVLKYQVDGSSTGQLLPGQDPAQAAFEEHMAFCNHLATHRLVLDLWDGDSLLQLGSCAVNLQGLLRQGREFAEVLVEVPVMQVPSQPTTISSATATAVSGHQQSPQQLGQLVVRMINIGRQPSNAAARVPDFDATEVATGPGSAGRKVRVRAAPLEPGSPVATEMRGRQAHNLSSIDWRRQQQQSAAAWQIGAAADGQNQQGGDNGSPAADVISFQQRKLARERQLHWLLRSAPNSSIRPGTAPSTPCGSGLPLLAYSYSPAAAPATPHNSPLRLPAAVTAAGGSGGWSVNSNGDDPFKAVQQQLLADVDAVRKRLKAGFIRSQLRKGLVTHCSIHASTGQTLLLQHALFNSLGRDAVFELRISHPQELQPVQSMQQLQQLQTAVDEGVTTTAAAGNSRTASRAGRGLAGNSAAVEVGGVIYGTGLSLSQLFGALRPAPMHGDASVQLANKGRIFVAANEKVSIPLMLRLQSGSSSADAGATADTGSQLQQPQQAAQTDSDQWQQQQGSLQHVVTVEFVPTDLGYPVNILELQVIPKSPVIDRTLRYHCAEREILRVVLPLTHLLPSPSQPVLAAATFGTLRAAASTPDVDVSVATAPAAAAAADGSSTGPVGYGTGSGAAVGTRNGQNLCELHIKYKCGSAPQMAQFHVWLYGDAAMAQPLETWQVLVHALRRVDMRAVIGQVSSTSLAIAGGTVDRQVACYSSHPAELQPDPQTLSLAAGGISALGLIFRPSEPGQELVRVHLVDTATKQLVHAFIVSAEALLPHISRTFEVGLQADGVTQKQIMYTNPDSHRVRRFNLSTNKPWLLSIEPATLEISPGGSKPVVLIFTGRDAAAGGVQQALMFVNDEHDSNEECIEFVIDVV